MGDGGCARRVHDVPADDAAYVGGWLEHRDGDTALPQAAQFAAQHKAEEGNARQRRADEHQVEPGVASTSALVGESNPPST